MKQKILGYVLARDEWPLLGLSICHVLSNGVDQVVVLDHASEDGTFDKLQLLSRSYPGQITVLRIDDDLFLQEEMTALVAQIARAETYDWIYVFDADEFILCESGKSLNDVLANVPEEIDVVRYQLDQWLSPSDFDDQEVADYLKIRHCSVPSIDILSKNMALGYEIQRGRLNFFDLPGPSKILVRGHLAHAISAGTHVLKTGKSRREMEFDENILRGAHLPLLSYGRLRLKVRQGRSFIEQGFPPGHGWQSQMLWRIDQDGGLESFWSTHSIPSSEEVQPSVGARAVTKIDDSLVVVLEAAIDALKKSKAIDSNELPAGFEDNLLTNPSILWNAAIRSLRSQSLERDVMLVDFNSQIAQLQDLRIGHEKALTERDESISRLNANVDELKQVQNFEEHQIIELSKSLEREKQISGELEFALSEVSKLNTKLTSSKAFRVGMLITWPARHLRSAMVAWFRPR